MVIPLHAELMACYNVTARSTKNNLLKEFPEALLRGQSYTPFSVIPAAF